MYVYIRLTNHCSTIRSHILGANGGYQSASISSEAKVASETFSLDTSEADQLRHSPPNSDLDCLIQARMNF